MSRKRSKPEPVERRIALLNWMEFGEIVPRETRTVLIPVGTLEAHGITSLGTDNEIPTRLAEAVAGRLDALIAPTIPYGVTAHLGALAGGVHVREEAFTSYVVAVLTTLSHQGFANLILMNGHGGNTEALKAASRRVHEETGAYTAVFDWWRETKGIAEETLGVPAGHAGADETAAMLAVAPDQVFPDRWDPSLAFEHRPSLVAYPLPGSLLFYGGRRSDPVFNTKKALQFWGRVVEHVGDVLEDLVVRWEREGWPAAHARRGGGRGSRTMRPGISAVPPSRPKREKAAPGEEPKGPS
jgi:creatinine amidohydrolase